MKKHFSLSETGKIVYTEGDEIVTILHAVIHMRVYTRTQNLFQVDEGLDVINTTLKFLTENISKQLLDFGIEDVLNTANKLLTIRENIDNFDFVNIKKFYSSKDKSKP